MNSKKKKDKYFVFSVPTAFVYEIQAETEEEAREILVEEGGLSIFGEQCDNDKRRLCSSRFRTNLRNVMWNYRIIKDKDIYGLYEVMYNDDGEICAHTEKPEIIAESLKTC